MSLLSDMEDVSELAALLGEFQRLLNFNGTVTALAGRRIDAKAAREKRFPPENESLVAKRIRNILRGTASTGVVSSAACGADILALECAGELRLTRRVVLPFPRERFRETSVADRGEEWGRRFDAILSSLDKDDIVEMNLEGSEDDAYAAANIRILDEAANTAAGQTVIAMVVWNDLPRGGTADLTDAFRKLALNREIETISVPTV